MHCSDFERTLAPLFQDVANMDFMWACRVGFAHMHVRGEAGRFLWHQPLNLLSHVQRGHGKPQMVLAAS